MIRTQISLTKSQHEGLRRLAGDRHVSMSTLIRSAVDTLLDESDEADARHRALRPVGMFASGHRDTSTHHDAAVAESIDS